MSKNRAEKLRENSYWLGIINNKYSIDKDLTTNYEEILKSITPEKLRKFIDETFKVASNSEVVMNGKAKEAK